MTESVVTGKFGQGGAKPRVLDFSFLDITNLEELNEKLDENFPEGEWSQGESGPAGGRAKVSAAAVRLPGNGLANLEPLWGALGSVVKEPASLRWLDLSFNAIARVPMDFADFTELMVLYLHANSIEKLTDLAPLNRLKNLRKLTLHGNAVENTPHYRSFVLLLCPNLRMLDFSVVTVADRAAAQFQKKAFDLHMKGRRKKED